MKRLILIFLFVFLAFPAGALALPAECNIQRVETIGGAAANPAFSPDGSRMAYYAKDAQGDYELRIDGQVIPSPWPDRHQTGPAWHPTANRILAAIEKPTHPAIWGRWLHYLFDNGLWSAMWSVQPDGTDWRLERDVRTDRDDGIMHIAISPDGRRVAWAQMFQAAREPDYPWGGYKLMLADWGSNGITNVRDITPSWGTLMEPGGWRGNKLIFGANDPDNPATTHFGTGDLDIWEMDVTSGALRNLTRDGDWDEHPSVSPDGTRIAYLNVGQLDLMNADGSGTEKLPMPLDFFEIPTSSDWSPDGRRLAVSTQTLWTVIPSNVAIKVLHFAGQCGS